MQEVFNKLLKAGLSPNAFYVLYCIHNKIVPSDLVNASIEVAKLKSDKKRKYLLVILLLCFASILFFNNHRILFNKTAHK